MHREGGGGVLARLMAALFEWGWLRGCGLGGWDDRARKIDDATSGSGLSVRGGWFWALVMRSGSLAVGDVA